jgi:hypothetical protein
VGIIRLPGKLPSKSDPPTHSLPHTSVTEYMAILAQFCYSQTTV